MIAALANPLERWKGKVGGRRQLGGLGRHRFGWMLVAVGLVFLSHAEAAPARDGLLLLTQSTWNTLTEAQKELYIKGFFETLSFMAYSYGRRTDQDLQGFSDWTRCATKESSSKSWRPYAWLINKEFHRTLASQFYEDASIVCKDHVGKGDRGLRPVRLVTRAAWQAFSLRDRSIYGMAYIETSYELFRQMNRPEDQRHLEICLRQEGIEGFLRALETTPMEWQYPLPWSMATALGKACKPYG